MNDSQFLVPRSKRPSWVEYPPSFCRLVNQQLVDLTPWHVMSCERAVAVHEGLTERYPTRSLFPFAYRQDNDDVACWAEGMGEKVFIVHDFASPGYENEAEFDSVWSWFRAAINETIDWD